MGAAGGETTPLPAPLTPYHSSLTEQASPNSHPDLSATRTSTGGAGFLYCINVFEDLDPQVKVFEILIELIM